MVRFKAPLDGETVVKDLVKGDVTFDQEPTTSSSSSRPDRPQLRGGDRRRDEVIVVRGDTT